MNVSVTEKAMALVLAAIVISFAAITPGLTYNTADAASITTEEKVQQAHAILTEKIINRDTKNIPMFMTYIDENSMLVVGISDKAPESLDVYRAKLENVIGADVPMRVVSGHYESAACNSRTADCTSMTGGIQVAYTTRLSTMTYATTDNSGRHGFIMTGHSTGWGVTGVDIGQATSSRIVGQVVTNPSGGGSQTRTSDSMFVQFNQGFSGDENTIYRSSGTTYSITGKSTSSQTPFNAPVRMSGVVSGYASGIINGKNLTITATRDDGTVIGTLTGQVMTTISVTQHGDSGAPIFSPPNASNQVTFYGIVVGIAVINGFTYTFYSPWEGISGELGVS